MESKNIRPSLIVHVIYRLGVGGLENGLVNLINQMPDDKYRHAIICLTESSEFSARIQRDDVEIIELHKKSGQDWKSFIRFYQILKRLRADIIHTRNLAAIEYQAPAFFAGIKYRVHSEHGWDVFDPEGNNKKYQWLRRLLSPLIQLFIPLSVHLQDYLLKKVKIPQDKIQRICNGVDTQKFYPTTNSKKKLPDCPFDFSGDEIYIGSVGRMHGVKDQITLVKAYIELMKKHQDLQGRVHLILVGDGPLKQQAWDLLEQYQLQHTAWLPGERKDIAEIMRCLDIFVLPSLAEGISNTILEAMATGLPVIATEVGGNPELVINGETGFIVPPENPSSMSEALYQMATDQALRNLLGENSYRRVQNNFSIQVMVNKYCDVYDALIKNKE